MKKTKLETIIEENKENIPVMAEMIKKKLIEEAINQGVYDAVNLIKYF